MPVTATTPSKADFVLRREGSIIIFGCRSRAAMEKLPDLVLEAWQMLGPRSFAVDQRYAEPLAAQLSDEGYSFADG